MGSLMCSLKTGRPCFAAPSSTLSSVAFRRQVSTGSFLLQSSSAESEVKPATLRKSLQTVVFTTRGYKLDSVAVLQP